ncbi:MAG: zf-HC2 domain-containing protein [Gemmatimonadaceae bacterium]
MQHLDEGVIHSWLDGALSAEEVARVKAHVDECAQCAAAVAEARGFVAASSRILTALDNVPKGVVPEVARAKPRNWAVWRAAAAVLVVALGSLAVLSERMTTRGSVADTAPMSAVSKANASAPDQSATDTARPEPSRAVVAAPRVVMTKPAATAPAANSPRAAAKIANQGTVSGVNESLSAAVSPPLVVTADVGRERQDNAAPRSAGSVQTALSGRVAGAVLPSRAYGIGETQAARGALSDPASAPTSIRVVDTPRVIGEKRTLYEVAPGDTVLLAEQLHMQLDTVVVRGTAATRVDTSTARQIRLRGATSMPTAADTQQKQAATSPPAAAVAAAPAPLAQTPNGITTIRWTDPATGNVMRLSGRHSAAELLEIRRRIEQQRTAEAAAKKKP